MYTDPRHRGKGVNAVIIEALKNGVVQNITELRLDVYHDNPSAIRAYEKQALKTLSI
jgi:GNAT superfamily N-acetyltransferase